jgi:diguanylate cyclase (GGDEF)-like protein
MDLPGRHPSASVRPSLQQSPALGARLQRHSGYWVLGLSSFRPFRLYLDGSSRAPTISGADSHHGAVVRVSGALIKMKTEDIILIAVAINLVIGLLAVFVPRLRSRRSTDTRSAAVRTTGATNGYSHNDNGNGTSPRPTTDDAGAPWFPARSASAAAVASATDPATGLDLGPAWARWLTEEDARVQRFRRPATIVLVELSGLDRLADRLGDEAAGRLIPPIAMTMRKNARASDHLARLGPTRFGAILTETDEIRAINFVERIRSVCDVWLEAGAVMLRLSVGWAEISADRPAEVALPDAEGRLFQERERTWAVLARQRDEPEVETGVLQPAQA